MFESLMMFVGGYEWVWIIVIVGVLLFGAKKIPELARGVGKGMGEFKKAKTEFEREIQAGEEEGKREWDETTKPKESTTSAPKD